MGFEVEGAKMENIMKLVEELIYGVMKKLKKKCGAELEKLGRKSGSWKHPKKKNIRFG